MCLDLETNLQAVRRGIAAFMGGFLLLSALARLGQPGLDTTLWCLDLRWLPTSLATGFTLLLALALLGVTARTRQNPRSQSLTTALLVTASAIALLDALVFWYLLGTGRIHSPIPLPASLIWAGAFAFILAGIRRGARDGRTPHPVPEPSNRGAHPPAPRLRSRLVLTGTALAWAALFPLIQIYCFGSTDYRRRADIAVVFGARVYANGSLSQAVADRVDTAARLYRQGLVQHIIVSGGPGDGLIHETEAMRRHLVTRGVPVGAIDTDRNGWNTAATVRNTAPLLRGQRVLAVSEFYHLPRIKLAYAAAGQEVYTVPAEASHWLRRWALGSIGREIPAFWAYYARAILPSIPL